MFEFRHIYNKLADYKINTHPRIRLMLDIFEAFSVIFSFIISIVLVRHIFIPSWKVDHAELALFSFFIIISWYVLSRVTAMAKLPRTQRYLTVIFQYIRVYLINLIGLIALKYLFNLGTIPILYILLYTGISMSFNLLIRMTGFRVLKIYRANGYNLHHVLVIADGFSDIMIDRLIHQKEWGFAISGIISKSRLIKAKYGKEIPIIPESENLKDLLDSRVIDEVLYCKGNINEEQIKGIVDICHEVGVVFRLQSTISPLDPFHMQLKTVNPSNYLTLVDIPSNNLSLVLKTLVDIYFSIVAIIVLSPFLLVIAFLIKWDSRGPVFFKQERIGLRGRKFTMYKFRTMSSNAEEILQRLKDKNEMDGPTFKMKDDPRITRLGLLLRKTGIDEFPQLFNVIRGEMSLIGPRPPLESEVKKYERWQLRRLSVKPGITCTWQIIPNRYDVKFERWMRMDLNYIDNWSFFNDIRLLFKTIRTLFLANGR